MQTQANSCNDKVLHLAVTGSPGSGSPGSEKQEDLVTAGMINALCVVVTHLLADTPEA